MAENGRLNQIDFNVDDGTLKGEFRKSAVVFGCTGQDGSYLSELLLDKGYSVVGVGRRSSVDTRERLVPRALAQKNFTYTEGDITDASSVSGIISEYKPDECYNLAAQSHVGTSFKQPVATFQIDAVGVLNILESIRLYSPHTRFYQASTSELFGDNTETDLEYTGFDGPHPVFEGGLKYQDDNTAFAPRSPYAVAKLAAHYLVHTYRESYGLHASCGILFNHESERRGENFVTKKITKWVGEFASKYGPDYPSELPHNDQLALGNLDAYRDWGHAEDFVYAMWLMLQQETPDDYVIATGEAHSVRDFLDSAFSYIGVNDWSPYVRVDPLFFRPAEVEYLCGKATKAEEKLGWIPTVTFDNLVERMVDHDWKKAQAHSAFKEFEKRFIKTCYDD